MAKNCIYCSVEIDSNSVVDMCYKCMYQVWGDKMTKTIIQNMERERNFENIETNKINQAIDNEEKPSESFQKIENSVEQSLKPQKIEDLDIETIPF